MANKWMNISVLFGNTRPERIARICCIEICWGVDCWSLPAEDDGSEFVGIRDATSTKDSSLMQSSSANAFAMI